MKTCKDCSSIKKFSDFYKHKHTKDGLRNSCKDCLKNKSKKKYQENPEAKKESNRKWHSKNKEKHNKMNLDWKNTNRDKYSEIQSLWYCNNKEYKNKKSKDHYENNKDFYKFKTAKRRAMKVKATLDGYDNEIKEIYKNCPEGYHVDHIMPLQGENLCGLHVPWNLQYLTAEENLKKGNKIIGENYGCGL